jgi:hypothetical protein
MTVVFTNMEALLLRHTDFRLSTSHTLNFQTLSILLANLGLFY